jgi:hypothetical protein
VIAILPVIVEPAAPEHAVRGIVPDAPAVIVDGVNEPTVHAATVATAVLTVTDPVLSMLIKPLPPIT